MRMGAVAVVLALVAPRPGVAQELNTISKVEVSGDAEKATVLITGSRRPTFQAYQQKGPVRVVVDVVKSRLKDIPPRVEPADNPLVRQVNVTQLGAAGRELSRLEIVFNDEVDYQMDAEGNTLRLMASKRSRTATPLLASAQAEAAGLEEKAKAEAARLEAERQKAEAARLEAEKAEAERKRAETERVERERIEREKAEAARLEAARQKAEAERIERERIEREQAEAARLEAERKKAEAERIERERIEREKAEAARLEVERKRAEAERIEREKAETARLEAERKKAEAERVQRERIEREKAEAARLEAERKKAEAQRIERERIEREGAEAARLEAERKNAETERLERIKAQVARAEQAQKVATARPAPAAPAGSAADGPRPPERSRRDDGFGGQTHVSEEAAEEAKPAEEAAEEPAAEAGGGPRVLTFVGFKNVGEHSRVIARTNEKVNFQVRKIGQNKVALELENCRITLRNNQRPLDTSFFNRTAVRMVTPEEMETGSTRKVRLVIELAEEVEFESKQEGNTVIVAFKRPAG